MPRSRRRRRENLPPGSPVYTGEQRDAAVTVHLIDYSLQQVQERTVTSTSGLRELQGTETVSWINLDGIHRVEEVQALCGIFGIHSLWMEDILNPSGRTKAESLGGMVLVVVKMLQESAPPEQVSLILCEGAVLTFQERPGDVWEGVRSRIREGHGRIRKKGADYLLHALMDAVVDRYFGVLGELEGRIERLEDSAMASGGLEPGTVFALKSELAATRHIVWPTREVVGLLLRSESERILPENLPYFRDLSDHLIQVSDLLELCRERVMGLFELRLALDGRRLNENMRVLTVVSAVFIPLTFLVGVYGMNFHHMPELAWRWGYPAVWGVMIAVAGGWWSGSAARAGCGIAAG